MLLSLTVLLASLAITLAAVPPIRRAAVACDLVDRPDQRRKLHGRIVPLGGGLAAYVGWLLPLAAVALWGGAGNWLKAGDGMIRGSETVPGETLRYVGLAAATGWLVALGLFDDRSTLRGRQKLVGQVFSVGLLILTGTLVERLTLFGMTIELGLLAAPFTAFFLLGSINAFNLLDGLDGLAGMIGVILGTAFCGMALLNPVGGPTALVSAALVGALFGFLAYNRPPATVFLGDAGSLWVGLTLGFVAIHSGPGRGGEWEAGALALTAPIAVWTIPIFDVLVAIIRRKLSGRSVYSADRGHLHHRLKINRSLSESRVLLTIGGLCTATAAAAVIGVALNQEWIAAAGALLVPATMVATRLFGFEEVVLLSKRTRGAARSLVPKRGPAIVNGGRERHFGLPDDPQWKQLWAQLLDHLDRYAPVAVRLEVDATDQWDHFFVEWNRSGERVDDRDLLRIDVPLGGGRKPIGRLRALAEPSDGAAVDRLIAVTDTLVWFEREVVDLFRSDPVERAEAPAAPAVQTVERSARSASVFRRAKSPESSLPARLSEASV
ncbi:glycosyltransferase family 4 protein [Alienimonas sp. DA493]|uniref:glycosyltransferase family 4 protein n=1 Tax=Alienimonas sp. DA493 TaxID=3373605 RepID=UPI003753FC7B